MGTARFMQKRNHTSGPFILRFHLPDERLSCIDRRLPVHLFVIGFMQLWNWAKGVVTVGFSRRVTQAIRGRFMQATSCANRESQD